jgi:hypothetical protein
MEPPFGLTPPVSYRGRRAAPSLTEGKSTSICSSGGTVVYQELDASTQTYAAPIEARCDAGERVEL